MVDPALTSVSFYEHSSNVASHAEYCATGSKHEVAVEALYEVVASLNETEHVVSGIAENWFFLFSRHFLVF
jgi:hypothetical protein